MIGVERFPWEEEEHIIATKRGRSNSGSLPWIPDRHKWARIAAVTASALALAMAMILCVGINPLELEESKDAGGEGLAFQNASSSAAGGNSWAVLPWYEAMYTDTGKASSSHLTSVHEIVGGLARKWDELTPEKDDPYAFCAYDTELSFTKLQECLVHYVHGLGIPWTERMRQNITESRALLWGSHVNVSASAAVYAPCALLHQVAGAGEQCIMFLQDEMVGAKVRYCTSQITAAQREDCARVKKAWESVASIVRLQRFIPEEERLRELNETLTATAAEAARKIETESDKTRLDSASDRMSPKLESWLATEKELSFNSSMMLDKMDKDLETFTSPSALNISDLLRPGLKLPEIDYQAALVRGILEAQNGTLDGPPEADTSEWNHDWEKDFNSRHPAPLAGLYSPTSRSEELSVQPRDVMLWMDGKRKEQMTVSEAEKDMLFTDDAIKLEQHKMHISQRAAKKNAHIIRKEAKRMDNTDAFVISRDIQELSFPLSSSSVLKGSRSDKPSLGEHSVKGPKLALSNQISHVSSPVNASSLSRTAKEKGEGAPVLGGAGPERHHVSGATATRMAVYLARWTHPQGIERVDTRLVQKNLQMNNSEDREKIGMHSDMGFVERKEDLQAGTRAVHNMQRMQKVAERLVKKQAYGWYGGIKDTSHDRIHDEQAAEYVHGGVDRLKEDLDEDRRFGSNLGGLLKFLDGGKVATLGAGDLSSSGASNFMISRAEDSPTRPAVSSRLDSQRGGMLDNVDGGFGSRVVDSPKRPVANSHTDFDKAVSSARWLSSAQGSRSKASSPTAATGQVSVSAGTQRTLVKDGSIPAAVRVRTSRALASRSVSADGQQVHVEDSSADTGRMETKGLGREEQGEGGVGSKREEGGGVERRGQWNQHLQGGSAVDGQGKKLIGLISNRLTGHGPAQAFAVREIHGGAAVRVGGKENHELIFDEMKGDGAMDAVRATDAKIHDVQQRMEQAIADEKVAQAQAKQSEAAVMRSEEGGGGLADLAGILGSVGASGGSLLVKALARVSLDSGAATRTHGK